MGLGPFNAGAGGGVGGDLENKQDKLTWDTAPTEGSKNPVTSDGIYKAVKKAQDTADDAAKEINKLTHTISLPSQNGTLTYSGSAQSPSWTGFDSAKMVLGGVTSGTDAGTYTATVTPAEGYFWEDESTDARNVTWTIGKASVAAPSQAGSLTYTGGAQSPSWSGYDTGKMTIGGTTGGTNAGSYSATFTPKANYQWEDGTTGAKTVTWSIGKAKPTVALDKTELSFTDPGTKSATVAVSRSGDGAVEVKSNNPLVAKGSISGTTLTVTAEGKNGAATLTVTVKEGTNYLESDEVDLVVTVDLPNIYGATWDGTSTTKWTRTDNSAEYADPVPYVAGASTYGSPFDELLPWSGMVRSKDSVAGEVVAIPKFWYSLTQTGSNLCIRIADKQVDGFVVSLAHMNRGDGKGERDVVYAGRYHCDSNYKSTTGASPKVSATRSAFRSGIHALGSTIYQSDWAMIFTEWLLYIVEFADWDSQTTIGYGCSTSSAIMTMGYTDSMPYHTGTTAADRTTYGGTQYRNIEGLWDNVYDWVDGCYYNGNGLNIILNPNNFSDTGNGTCAGTLTSGWPSAFKVTTAGGFPLFMPSASSGSATTYSCDFWYFGSSSPCLCRGGSYSQNTGHGLFFVNYSSASYSSGNIGSRLQILP